MRKIAVVGIPGGWSSEKLAAALLEKTGFRFLINMAEICFDVATGKICCGDLDLAAMDAIIIKKVGSEYSPHLLNRLSVLQFLNENGVRIFSKPAHISRILNRLDCTMALRLAGIPLPETVVTENLGDAVAVIKKFQKAVLKPLYTSKARGMKIVESNAQARSIVETFQKDGNPMIYIQKFVPIPGRDLGIVFLGGKYLATYARVAGRDSWNTTTASGGKYEPYEPSPEIIELAHRAQSFLNLDFTCVDLVETADGPKVFEVSAFGGFKGLWEAHGLDAADLYANYVLEEINHDSSDRVFERINR